MLSVPSPTLNNLPQQLTSFIGREQEIDDVKQRLALTRLFTLTGTGGTGKTRFALRVAADLLDEYSGGVWFVDLSQLEDTSLVPQTVVFTLGLREEPGLSPVDTLSNHINRIRPMKVLVLLDNCEHLIGECASLAGALLRACPNLCILATSRQALSVPGEVVWQVPPLSVPNPKENIPIEKMNRCDAVQLFIERAKLRRPEFMLVPDNAHAVAQLCSQLDGLPLAIELAAARLNVLSVEEIVSKLNERFRLFSSGRQATEAVPRRQQTLRALMDWSYDILSESEQLLLRSLSVFAGGFTRESAATVWGGEIDEYETLELLSQLVDKSLVIKEEHGGQSRYRLLETVRQYAWDKLRATGELIDLRNRHRKWYVELAERVESDLQGPQGAVGLNLLDAEYDNLRAALQWTLGDRTLGDKGSKTKEVEEDATELGLRLVVALWYFWSARGYWSEGRKWLDSALALSEDLGLAQLTSSATTARAKLFYAAGWLATRQNDYVRGASLLEQSLKLSLQVGNKRGVAESLASLSWLAMEQGDYERARSTGQEGLTLWRELGDKRGIALALHRLGFAALGLGNVEYARALLEESLAISRELRDDLGIANALLALGEIARLNENWDKARVFYEEALAIFRQSQRRSGVSIALANLGILALRQGDLVVAQAHLEESLSISRDLGSKYGIIYCLIGIAGVQGAQGRPEQAASILGLGDTLLQATSIQLESPDRVEYDRIKATVRSMLDEDIFAAMWQEGQTLSMEQAIEFALQAISHETPDSQPISLDVPPAALGATNAPELTKRELEVLRLVAKGLTNPEAAYQLNLSVHTVEAHLRSIYSKLGVTTRSAAARYAHENNIE